MAINSHHHPWYSLPIPCFYSVYDLILAGCRDDFRILRFANQCVRRKYRSYRKLQRYLYQRATNFNVVQDIGKCLVRRHTRFAGLLLCSSSGKYVMVGQLTA